MAISDSSVFSGAELVFGAVCRDLARSGHEVRALISSQQLADDLGELAVKRIPAQPTRLAGLHLPRPARLLGLRRALAGVPGEALLVNLPSGEYGPSALLVDRRPAVGLLHVHTSLKAAGFRFGALRQSAGAVALRRAARVLAAAPDADLTPWGVSAARTGPLPLPRPHVMLPDRAASRAELGLGSGPTVVLIGRLSIRQKGHDVLLAAVPRLRERAPGIQIAICGEGPDRGHIRELAAPYPEVVMTGHVGAGTALAAADAIALPSRFEGLPLVALEALAAGVPGVVSDVDGLRAAWPAAHRVAPDDPTALADALARVLIKPRAPPSDRLAELTTEHPGEAVARALEAVT